MAVLRNSKEDDQWKMRMRSYACPASRPAAAPRNDDLTRCDRFHALAAAVPLHKVCTRDFACGIYHYGRLASPLHVMAGFVPAIHVFLCRRAPESKTWMPATSAGMTTERADSIERNRCSGELENEPCRNG